MRVNLISLPWKSIEVPPLGVSALSAYVKKHEPNWKISNFYPYLDIAHDIGVQQYRVISENAYEICEALYAAILYPENEAYLKESFVKWALKKHREGFGNTLGQAEKQLESILATLKNHLEKFVQNTKFGDIVGFSTCFFQTFASVVYSRRIKEFYPQTRIVLGGIGVSPGLGESIIKEYPFIDYIVQGEGEQPFLALLRQIRSGKKGVGIKGVVSQKKTATRRNRGEPREISDLDQLPTPDFEAYFKEAYDRYNLERIISIEGSRGCWWDRRNKLGNKKHACAFCNLNIQWKTYREKSARKIMAEILELSRLYKSTAFDFMDNSLRVDILIQLAEEIKKHNMKIRFSSELRPAISPYEILILAEAGLDGCQIGIESLSSSLLKRMNKGTTVIKNLEIMKTFFELGFEERFNSNLIINFPGSSQQELDETIHNIRNYAVIYTPLRLSDFALYRNSVIECSSDEFGIAKIRNSEKYRNILPQDVFDRIQMIELSYDSVDLPKSWELVFRAVEEWRERHTNKNLNPGWPLLTYHDGGSFLKIEDNRWERKEFILEGVLKEIYLFCAQIRTFQQISKTFSEKINKEGVDLKETLELYLRHSLAFKEDNRYLSLAVAPSVFLAIDRIRSSSL